MRARHPWTAAILLAAAACATSEDSTGLLNAVAWTQTAAEHDALCAQVFAAATAAVEAAAATARDRDRKPLAVIVDVDETALDNAPYQARLVLDQEAFDPASWSAWCTSAQAAAVPGALAFAQRCRAREVTVFYVTNRAAALEAPTRANLARLGFPLEDRDGVDVVLCLGDADGKPSKAGRRARVAEQFDVVAVVGDDLHDFVDAPPSIAARRALVEQHAGEWGRAWFVLPNPMYGSWERAAKGEAATVLSGKRAALQPMR
jgi:acid phosphatase